ncbi:MAG: DUF4159 domain-containing protein [Acidobacteria bacterium]|nr:DUF4159 domain-containing protein [Acidobacteriota bacterium]
MTKKSAAFLLLLALFSLAALGLRPAVEAALSQRFGESLAEAFDLPPAVPDDSPEFYFTRLVYTENGWRRSRTMSKPDVQYTCPEFGTGRFFPRQGWGWATDYPGADCKFMGAVHRLTGVRVHPNPNVISITDPDLFKFPFLYAVEVGGMYLSDEEAVRLRTHLLRGGFLHVDDFWGLRQKANFEAAIKKVFPDRPLQSLPLTHPVFHTFFDIDTVVQVPNVGNGCYGRRTWEQSDDIEPAIYGISDDRGRLMVLVTYNADLGDAWEYMDLACYPEKFSGYSYRIGINFMIYAMTH